MSTPYPDTTAVATFMTVMGQTVRTVPTADIPDDERVLRARLVFEETMELLAALGCQLVLACDSLPVEAADLIVESIPGGGVDLVEATDAIADIVVTTKGTGLTLGIPQDAAFEAVHATNMAKLGPDGTPIRDGNGKVVKPTGWVPPTKAIEALLDEAGQPTS